MGVPLLANSQLGTFYPPNWLGVSQPAPDAIRLSILLHVGWAFGGAYLLARRTTGVGRLAALAAALVFALGGHVGAHVEQINQLQGLAWLPWAMLLLSHALDKPLAFTPLLGAVLALQLLAGHTQTVFITGVGLGLFGLLAGRWRFVPVLLGAVTVAIVLALPQLIPTLELTGSSNRSGGFNQNQATAFSFSPFVVGRGLLPSYDRALFGEYVAYVGVVGLGLALLGVLSRTAGIATRVGRRQPAPRVLWAVIAVVGLLLAFGLYNPLYWWLASLPGFNLFRVPARWLALFALGAAMLVALGVQALRDAPDRGRWRVLVLVGMVAGGLAALSPLAPRAPEQVPAHAPEMISFAGWALAMAVFGLFSIGARRLRGYAPLALVLALAVELFAASLVLPYNDLVPPDTYRASRFTIDQLRVFGRDDTPPGRTLSISSLYFDPGDRAALEARYAALGLSSEAVSTAFTALKMKETLAPNLPLTWGIPSIDGFDGGLLPTSAYTAFSSLLLPDGEPRTLDGRLYEVLARSECGGACLPARRWLDLTNTRYLITDKVYDVWFEDVAYDTQLPQTVDTGHTLAYTALPDFTATAVDVLFACANAACAPPRVVTTEPLPAPDVTSVDAALWRGRYLLAAPGVVGSLSVSAGGPVTVVAASLVDTRTGDFVQLTPPPWRRVLSSDIKLYENGSVLPRAFVVHDWRTTADDWQGSEDALALMRADDFDPALTALLAGDDIAAPVGTVTGESQARIVSYAAEQVEIEVNAAAAGYLILTDAHYPGWTASVNGEPVPVRRANVLFRAVEIPAGHSVVRFAYQPEWLPGVLVAGGAAWLGVLGFAALTLVRRGQRG